MQRGSAAIVRLSVRRTRVQKRDPRSGAIVATSGDSFAVPTRTWRLLDARGQPYQSARPGTLGGHRRTRIYGRFDCPSARRALDRGGYAAHRVFFADEATAVAAGFRPCATCLPRQYANWKRDPAAFGRSIVASAS
ncbi:MAG: metal-binding protein [Thermomicrobiales bacterium]|nr:metal-binding protein [Thermomicrobiales bacterium]